MTKKVTEETLKKIIEGVLKERDYNQKVVNITNRTMVKRGLAKKVADLADDDNQNLTPADFDVVLNDPSRLSADTSLQKAVTSFSEIDPVRDKDGKKFSARSTMKKDFPQIKADAEAALEKLATAQSYRGPASIVMPSLTSAGGDAGVFSQSQMTIFNSFFEDSLSFQERIKKISDFSMSIFNASKDETLKLTENQKQLLTSIMVLDSLNFIVKDFESGSSAYLFEAFLALMGGGKILGKETTDAGKMGGADFEYNQGGDTFKGSSKYYAKGSSLGQSPNGFNLNEPVLYIVALKKQTADATGIGGAAATSDPTKIVKLSIYSFSVVKTSDGGAGSDGVFKFSDKDGNVIDSLKAVNVPSGEELKIGGANRGLAASNFVGDIMLASSNTSGLREMLSSALENQDEKLRIAADAFNGFFKEVNEAKEGAQSYLANGNESTGIEALESIDESQGFLEAMFNSIKEFTNLEFGKDSTGKRQAKQLTKEQKITSNFLKKLIEESFKK